MDEDVKVAAGTRARIVHQTRAAGFETRNGIRKVGDYNGYVMEPLAEIVDELGDYRIRFRGFEQFYARLARGQHRDVDLFLLDRFAETDREAELLLVKSQSGVERSHGNSEMINLYSV